MAETSETPLLELSDDVVDVLRQLLADVADNAVDAITEEVPSYAGALSGPMGATIRDAVQLALGTFLTLATQREGNSPMAPALKAAYQLGRGEARSGRSMEALLAAYRVGARVSWRDMSQSAVALGVDAAVLSRFAELVFAYIDELSAASVAGHTEELDRSGRLRQRNLERLARALLDESDPETVAAAAERASWEPPATLTAVVVPESRLVTALSVVDPASLQAPEDLSPATLQGERAATLLVPAGAGGRTALLAALRGSGAVVGPTVPWAEVAASYDRASRCLSLEVVTQERGEGRGEVVDTDDHLARVVLGADPGALADLRRRVLAPLADLRPSTAEKLTETLRSWLLHHGRRDAVAAELFVHPQTVRYRVGQLREVYGDRLEDPAFVLEATLALA